jgi:tetratricopeptide (TPR) repeat protein
MRRKVVASITLFIATTVLLCAVSPSALYAQARTQRAQELFTQGEQAYAEGRFEDAAGLMREAYGLSPEPILLYNLARALEAQGDWEGAIEAYSQYLESPGELTHRGRATAHRRAAERQLERERELRALAGARAGSGTSSEDRDGMDAPPPPAPSGHEVAVAPWILVGGGVALVGVGAVFGVLAVDRQAAAQAAPNGEIGYAALKEGENFAIAANVLLITGGIAAGAGLIWGIVDLTSSSGPGEQQPQARLSFGAGSIAVRGTF